MIRTNALIILLIASIPNTLLADSKNVTLQSSDGQYQLSAPSGWAAFDFHLDNVQIGARNKDRGEFAEVIVEQVQDYTSSLSQYAAAKRDTIAMCLDNARLSAGSTLKINDQDAIRFEIHGQLPNSKIVVGYLLTVIKDKDKYVQIVAWTDDSHFADNLSEMQSLAGGFSELDQKNK
jgi:hypothetical protein